MNQIKQCPVCLNNDPTYFYLGSRGWYCRRCIDFSLPLTREVNEVGFTVIDTEYHLNFNLSEKQKVLANELKSRYQSSNILVHAACGAGKTELVLDMIVDGLSKGYRFGWAIPRRSVVLQLTTRLKQYFPSLKIVAVCEGYTDDIYGDLIICTTHQLFRYHQFFDYLIIDEPDAFPFKGNELLQNIAITSTKVNHIYLTATPDKYIIQRCNIVLKLFARPFGYPLTIPVEIRSFKSIGFIILVYLISNKVRKLMVFFPTIVLAKKYFEIFNLFISVGCVTSKTKNKDQIVERFISGDLQILFTTTILERGITIANIDVIVFQANHDVFDVASLVQIAGRVGRVKEYPSGDVYFITNEKSERVRECIELIKQMNKNA